MFGICFGDIIWYSIQASDVLEIFVLVSRLVAFTQPLKNPESKIDFCCVLKTRAVCFKGVKGPPLELERKIIMSQSRKIGRAKCVCEAADALQTCQSAGGYPPKRGRGPVAQSSQGKNCWFQKSNHQKQYTEGSLSSPRPPNLLIRHSRQHCSFTVLKPIQLRSGCGRKCHSTAHLLLRA